jgi:hypothetical protein
MDSLPNRKSEAFSAMLYRLGVAAHGSSPGLLRACPLSLRSKPMWVLIYIFSYSASPAATNDRAEWRLLPTVVFQEFSSEERCKAGKSKIEDTLKEAGTKLRSGLDDLKRAGAADPAQIIIAYNVECLPK